MNNKNTNIIALVLAVIALCLSIFSMSRSMKPAPAAPAEEEQKDIQYVLYLGTNDKDTNVPVFAPDEAKAKAEEILINYFGGYTVQEANGGWIDDNGTVYQENTIVIYLSDTDLEQVHSVCDELIRVFNQSSVLVQANETTTEFYEGGSN